MLRLVAAEEKRAPMDDITVVVVTSPIPSHPDTRIIDETIASIRTHLPDSEILICIDGIRDEQADYTEAYREYTRRILWKCNFEWGATPLLFDKHEHQARMTRNALEFVKSPAILFMEHDTPLTPDREIPFKKLVEDIKSGKANIIRLHHEALVLDVHRYLMIGEPEDGLWATYQWSQRPHLASTKYYKYMLHEYFPLEARTMIEDNMYGKLESAYRDRGQAGWNEFKVWLYYPAGDIKRSYHTDGREGDPKYEDTFGIN